jgi:hypothetical protein
MLADRACGGGGGIRTHEGLSSLPVFKTGAFNHSATPPTRINQAVKDHSAQASKGAVRQFITPLESDCRDLRSIRLRLAYAFAARGITP